MSQSAFPDTDSDLDRPQPPVPLWRNRDYLLLWSGQAVSTLGSGISGLAFPLLVLSLTGSPAQAGFVAAVSGVPWPLISLPAGARWIAGTGSASSSYATPSGQSTSAASSWRRPSATF